MTFHCRFFGIHEFSTPVIIVRDPNLIKTIAIKDFDHFVNHRIRIEKDVEPMWGRSLFVIRDQEWKRMRTTLSPIFTGSKMRLLFKWINVCAENTCNDIKARTANGPVDFDCKEMFKRYAADVIATCVFGLDVNSARDRDNEFYRRGNDVAGVVDGKGGLKFSAFIMMPRLMKLLRVKVYDDELVNFFRHIVISTIEDREKTGAVRNDLINLLMQTRKGLVKDDGRDGDDAGFATVSESEQLKSFDEKHINWEDDDLTAQCVLFFLAGFDTTSNHLSFVAYELAMNPDVQDRLIEEIDEVSESLDGNPVGYDVFQGMKYMDMVFCEALRKWPPISLLNRECSKSTVLTNNDGKTIQLNPGDGVWFPIRAIQNDRKYFTNPEKFNPERFSEENKKKIDPFTFMPFGHGPRNCIASRFGLIESKAVIYHLLRTVRFEKAVSTETPPEFKKDSAFLKTERNIVLKLVPR